MTDHQYNPGWPGYDLRADVALKECGNAIFDLLREQSALPPSRGARLCHGYLQGRVRRAADRRRSERGERRKRCGLSCLSSRLPGLARDPGRRAGRSGI